MIWAWSDEGVWTNTTSSGVQVLGAWSTSVQVNVTPVYSSVGNRTNEGLAANDDNWWGLLALALVIGTAGGNILVCLAISWERRLQNVTNYFLMSLAITDLMVAILVMPLGILTLVRGE